MEMPLKCEECERKFSTKSNLTRHLRVVHGQEIERIDIQPADFEIYNYKCLEGCKISFKYNRELRNHLRIEHNLDLTEVNLEFPNSEEFTKWLYEEETNNNVQYMHTTATKKKSTGTETCYYECNRSGKCHQVVEESARKRKPRKNGTLKLNRGCTSQIISNKSHDGSYTVYYFKTHYGHDNDLEHLKLSKSDREIIASKLLLGISPRNVLQSVETNAPEKLKRINLLNPKDVFNIKRAKVVNLKVAMNINSFIKECLAHPLNPILYHTIEEVSNNVCIIIMNKYQTEILLECAKNRTIMINTTTLNHGYFELTTLFVVYENGESFPAACMFSNPKDLEILEKFFEKIRKKVGSIKPEILITNISPLYYEAWKNVMGAVENVFYSPEQVEYSWKLNLNRIYSNEADVTRVKRKWVHDNLKIMRQTQDETELLDSFAETLKFLEIDPDFRDFPEYFKGNFSKVNMWADLYQSNCDLSHIHWGLITDILKQYLNHDKENKFEKVFHSMLRFIRDETVNSMIKSKVTRSNCISANDARHLLQPCIVEAVAGDSWNVEQDFSNYVVQRHLQKKCCDLICSTCHICIHCFSCTCVDFFVSSAICKHIHYIWVNYFQSIETAEDGEEHNEDASNVDFDEEIVIEVDEDSNESHQAEDELQHVRNEIIEKTAEVNSCIANILSVKKLKIILGNLNTICDFVASPETTPGEEALIVDNTVLSDHSYL